MILHSAANMWQSVIWWTVCLVSLQAATGQVMNDYQQEKQETQIYEIFAIVTVVTLVLVLLVVCLQSKVRKACKKKSGPQIVEIPGADIVELEIDVDDKGNRSRVRRSSAAGKERSGSMSNGHTDTSDGARRLRTWSTESPPSNFHTAVLLNLSEEQLDKVISENPETAAAAATDAVPLDKKPESAESEEVLETAENAQKRLLEAELDVTPVTSVTSVTSETPVTFVTSETIPLLNLTPATPVPSEPSSPTNSAKSPTTVESGEVSKRSSDAEQEFEVDSDSGLKTVPKPRDYYETPTLDRKADVRPLLDSELLDTSQ